MSTLFEAKTSEVNDTSSLKASRREVKPLKGLFPIYKQILSRELFAKKKDVKKRPPLHKTNKQKKNNNRNRNNDRRVAHVQINYFSICLLRYRC